MGSERLIDDSALPCSTTSKQASKSKPMVKISYMRLSEGKDVHHQEGNTSEVSYILEVHGDLTKCAQSLVMAFMSNLHSKQMKTVENTVQRKETFEIGSIADTTNKRARFCSRCNADMVAMDIINGGDLEDVIGKCPGSFLKWDPQMFKLRDILQRPPERNFKTGLCVGRVLIG